MSGYSGADRGSPPGFFGHIYANLGDSLKDLGEKRVGMRPLHPPLDPRLGLHYTS